MGDLTFAQLPPGLRYGLSTTNVIAFPHSQAKPDNLQVQHLVDAMATPSSSPAVVTAEQAQPHAVRPPSQLAQVPATTPALDVDMGIARSDNARQLTEALLAAADAQPARILLCGMGGIGKTTLAAVAVRSLTVRQHFTPICFVTVGMEPEILPLQRILYEQLAGKKCPVSKDDTVATMLELLQKTARLSKHRALVVLDDIWSEEQLPPLDFIWEETGSRLLVTSRFTGLVTRECRELPVGLLASEDASDLLLKLAEVRDRSQQRVAAAQRIVKLCGYLPLFINLVARIICELGPDHAWENEIISMLEEHRSTILTLDAPGAGVAGAGVGNQIYLSSLSRVEAPEAKELFEMLAVLPEDVPAPLDALEMIWCAHKQIKPPLSRLDMSMLRRCVFELLNRSLVLGAPETGIYCHDVIRDFCRSSVGAKKLQQRQRSLVNLLVQASPASGGWQHADARHVPLTRFVLQAFRFHVREALQAGEHAQSDVKAWSVMRELPGATFLSDFIVRSCAAEAGVDLLEEAAEAACAAGELWFAARLYAMTTITPDFAMFGGWEIGAHPNLKRLQMLFLRAVECYGKIPDSNSNQRTEEVMLRSDFTGIFPQDSDVAKHNLERQNQLATQGLADPASDLAAYQLGTVYFYQFTGMLGSYSYRAWVERLDVEKARTGIKQAKRATKLLLRGALSFSEINLLRMAHIVAGPTIAGISSEIISFGLPGEHELHMEGIIDPELVTWCHKMYDFEKIAPLTTTIGIQLDTFLTGHNYTDYYVATRGDIGLQRTWDIRLLEFIETLGPEDYLGVDGGSPRVGVLPGARAMVGASRIHRIAGGVEYIRKQLLAMHLTSLDAVDTGMYAEFIEQVCKSFYWKEKNVVQFDIFGCKALFKLALFLAAPDAVDVEAFRAWLPEPGRVYLGPVTSECPVGMVETMMGGANIGYLAKFNEVDAFHQLGQLDDAQIAARLLKDEMPFHSVTVLFCKEMLARAAMQFGRTDEGEIMFAETIAMAAAMKAPFLELMVRSELLVARAATTQGSVEVQGFGSTASPLALLGRSLAQLVCPPQDYTPLLSCGVDAELAVTAYRRELL